MWSNISFNGAVKGQVLSMQWTSTVSISISSLIEVLIELSNDDIFSWKSLSWLWAKIFLRIFWPLFAESYLVCILYMGSAFPFWSFQPIPWLFLSFRCRLEIDWDWTNCLQVQQGLLHHHSIGCYFRWYFVVSNFANLDWAMMLVTGYFVIIGRKNHRVTDSMIDSLK